MFPSSAPSTPEARAIGPCRRCGCGAPNRVGAARRGRVGATAPGHSFGGGKDVDLGGTGGQPHGADHGVGPAGAVGGVQAEAGDGERVQQLIDDLVHLALERLTGVAGAVEGRRLDDGHLEQAVVGGHPVAHEGIVSRTEPGLVDQIGVVVQDGAVADDDVVARRRDDLFRDLGVEDPGLGLEGGVLVDGQGAGAGDFLDQLDGEVEALEAGGDVEAERCLAHAVAADECDLHGRYRKRRTGSPWAPAGGGMWHVGGRNGTGDTTARRTRRSRGSHDGTEDTKEPGRALG